MINSYYEGFVRAREIERRHRRDRAVVIDEVVRPSMRYRLGRRLVVFGAHLMGSEAEAQGVYDDLRPAA